ncbi:terminase large subunit [Achromobacter phage nyashin_LB6]|nr:terminase large subunit [Achromobacter phage nyashin_LB6]
MLIPSKSEQDAIESVLQKALREMPAPEIVWKPLPGSQTFAFTSPAAHTLYEGARGPGKTVTQLMRFLRHVGKGYGQFWRGVIFDLEHDNLSGIVAESKKWFNKFNDGAKFQESTGLYKWVWPTGEELLFRHVKKIEDYEGFHGHEYPFIGWNELTKHPTGDLYEKFMSVNRSSFDPITHTPQDEEGNYLTWDGKPLPPIPLEVFSTTNPSGPGHNWVKDKFIDPAPRGTIVRNTVRIFNPQTQQEEDFETTQVAIFGSYKENPFLPPDYIAQLSKITDENLRRAWLYGDWEVTAGGALDDLWKARVHVVERFVIPESWYIDRSYDDGRSHPFSVGWWAESDGTEAVLPDGTRFCPPAGSLIQIAEWYGTEKIGTNKGIQIGSKAIARGINDREMAMYVNGWIKKQPRRGPADNRIRNVIDDDTETPAKIMEKEGIYWNPSDKSSGSRTVGLELIRERLLNAINNEGPAIYFMRNCVASIKLLPGLQRDAKNPDDVDTKQEDHPYDMVRYRCLVGADKAVSSIKVTLPT